MQKLKGLWIPADILLDEKLTDKEKIILSMIIYLSDEIGSCFASNQYIAIVVKVTPKEKRAELEGLGMINYAI